MFRNDNYQDEKIEDQQEDEKTLNFPEPEALYQSRANPHRRYTYFFWLCRTFLGEDMYTYQDCFDMVTYSQTIFSNPFPRYIDQSLILFFVLNLSILIFKKIILPNPIHKIFFQSGRKLLVELLSDPLYALFFYLSFYFAMLSHTEEQMFNKFVKFVGLPQNRKVLIDKKIVETFVEDLSMKLGYILHITVGNQVKEFIKEIMGTNLLKFIQQTTIQTTYSMISQGVANIPNITRNRKTIIKNVIKNVNDNIKKYSKYIPQNITDYLQSRMELLQNLNRDIAFLDNNIKNILPHVGQDRNLNRRNSIKRSRKNKESRKKYNREKLCKDNTCKDRIRLDTNLYCKSECKTDDDGDLYGKCSVDENEYNRWLHDSDRNTDLNIDIIHGLFDTNITADCNPENKYRKCLYNNRYIDC